MSIPGNNTPQPQPQKPKKEPEQKPAPAPAPAQEPEWDGTSLVGYSVNSLDTIVQQQLADFSGLLNIMAEIAQKLKDGEYPEKDNVPVNTNNDNAFTERLMAQQLAESLQTDLTANWKDEEKVLQLGFSIKYQIQKLLKLTPSARELLGKLIIDTAYGQSLGDRIALESATKGTIDTDLEAIADLAYQMRPKLTSDQLLALAVNQLELLATTNNTVTLFAANLANITTPEQLFKQFPGIINPLLEIGQGVLEDTQLVFGNNKLQHRINMLELETKIKTEQKIQSLQALKNMADKIVKIVGDNNNKKELEDALLQENIAKNKADAQQLATGILLAGIVLKGLQHTDPIILQKVRDQITYRIKNVTNPIYSSSTIQKLILPKPLPSITRIVPPAGYTTPKASVKPIPGVTGGNAQIQRGLQTMLGFIKRAKGRG